MNIKALSSAIYNDIVAGLSGYEASMNMSLEQLEDEIIQVRLEIIKKYAMKNLIPKKDLYQSINCIQLDCETLDKCCVRHDYDQVQLHFEIPQIVNDFGEDAIGYIGSTNKQLQFKVYTNTNFGNHKYKMRGSQKPFVYIDTTPNKNNLYDCYVFNAPMLERLSVIGIFKDPRQLQFDQFKCCPTENQDEDFIPENLTWLTSEIKETLVKRKLVYYRQYYQQSQPNDQVPK
jgi:hypothetical protein